MSKKSPPEVQIRAQGHLLSITRTTRFDGRKNGTRGEISGFSNKSRKRLLELLARLEEPESRGYRFKVSFLTLTTKVILLPENFKSCLFTFFKRLRRKYPQIAAIWRMEFQARGAPHAHILLYNAPWIDKGWIQKSWGEIVLEERPFTRIEMVKSYKSMISYAAKYMAKIGGFNNVPKLTVNKSTGELTSVKLGRMWGVFQRELLNFAEVYEATIPLDGSWWLIRRYCRKMWDGLDPDSYDGFTIFCDNPRGALAYIKTLSRDFINADEMMSLFG